MTTIASTSIGCAVLQIFGLDELNKKAPTRTLNDLTSRMDDEVGYNDNGDGSFVFLFADADHNGNGAWLEQQIRRLELGTVKKVFGGFENPQTHNRNTVWAWKWNGKIPKARRS